MIKNAGFAQRGLEMIHPQIPAPDVAEFMEEDGPELGRRGQAVNETAGQKDDGAENPHTTGAGTAAVIRTMKRCRRPSCARPSSSNRSMAAGAGLASAMSREIVRRRKSRT